MGVSRRRARRMTKKFSFVEDEKTRISFTVSPCFGRGGKVWIPPGARLRSKDDRRSRRGESDNWRGSEVNGGGIKDIVSENIDLDVKKRQIVTPRGRCQGKLTSSACLGLQYSEYPRLPLIPSELTLKPSQLSLDALSPASKAFTAYSKPLPAASKAFSAASTKPIQDSILMKLMGQRELLTM